VEFYWLSKNSVIYAIFHNLHPVGKIAEKAVYF